MSSEVETLAAKLNASNQLSRIMGSRGTEISENKVIALDLSELNITDLPSGVFDGLGDLERVNLGYNNLTTVDPKVFAGLSKLTFLSFYANQISELPDDFMSMFPDLEWLDLRENGLTKIPSSVIGLKKLVYLYLQNNPELTSDDYDFSADYHSKRDVAKFVEEYQKSTDASVEKPPVKKPTKKATKKVEEKESTE